MWFSPLIKEVTLKRTVKARRYSVTKHWTVWISAGFTKRGWWARTQPHFLHISNVFSGLFCLHWVHIRIWTFSISYSESVSIRISLIFFDVSANVSFAFTSKTSFSLVFMEENRIPKCFTTISSDLLPPRMKNRINLMTKAERQKDLKSSSRHSPEAKAFLHFLSASWQKGENSNHRRW